MGYKGEKYKIFVYTRRVLWFVIYSLFIILPRLLPTAETEEIVKILRNSVYEAFQFKANERVNLISTLLDM